MAVRNEAVRLSLEDAFTSEMAKAAAVTALLSRELNSLSGQAVQTSRSTHTVAQETDGVARSASKAEPTINRLSGRLGLLADTALILGPALIPIGAVGIPAVAGLANQLGIAALAGITAIAAFQGVGGALKAVNTAALDPTTANLEKARAALEDLSPAAQELVHRLHDLQPVLKGIRDVGAEGLFPGIETSIDLLETRLPDVERLVSAVSQALGDTAAAGAADLASARWDDFFRFLADEAPQTLSALGQITGNLAHGLAELWMAFAPLNHGFTSWLLDVAAGFDRWASGLAQTQGFTEFIDYIRTNGPQVLATAEALANALLQIVEAAAPLGGPVLNGLEAVFKLIAAIADSDLGTPIMAGVVAMRLLSRATDTYGKLTETAWGARAVGNVKGMAAAMTTVTSAQDRARLSAVELAKVEAERATATRSGLATIGKGAAAVGALALVASGAADDIGLTNTASLGLLGTMGGPWGAALGAAAGAVMDLSHANDELDASNARASQAINTGSIPAMRKQRAEIKATLDEVAKHTDSKTGGIGGLVSDAFHLPANMIKYFSGAVDEGDAALGRLDEAISRTKLGAKGLPELLGGDLLHGLGLTAAGFDSASQSASQFQREVDRINNVLTGRASLRDYQAALDDFRKAVKDNGKTLDITTEKGRNVQSALDGIAGTAVKAAQSLHGLKRERYLDQARKDFIGAAQDLGKTRAQAEKLADRLGLVDRIKAQPKVELQGMVTLNRNLDELNRHFDVIDHLMGGPTVKLDGAQAVNSALNGVLSKLSLLDGYTAHSYVTTTHTSIYTGDRRGLADGGVVDYYANGGLRENHIAQIAPAGAMRVWAEPETGGEAYIPLAPSKRDRSRAIAAEVVSRLGGSAQFAANGMITGPASSPVVQLSEGQFRRLEAATERGTAKGAAKGMKVLTHAITAEESF